MNPRTFGTPGSLAALVLLAACSSGNGPPTPDVRYAYVVLGPGGQAVARAITSASSCPSITFDGGAPVQMTVRAAAGDVAPRPTAYDPVNAIPTSFPVTTCDAAIPAGTTRAMLGQRPLPLPKSQVRRILMLGDTGCRMKVTATDAEVQDCDDPAAWPLASIAAVAASMTPDLVLHVGDFHYRETPCPAGTPCADVTTHGFGWASWEPDFFAPMQDLFAAAPWVVVRGDHETCDRGGQGWWRFLDPRPLVAGQDCNLAANDVIGSYSDPYVVPLGDDVASVVFDSAIVGDTYAPSNPDAVTYWWQAQEAFAQAAPWPHTLFVNHQPILAYNSSGSKHPGKAAPGNPVLQGVLRSLFGTLLFPASVDAVLSGHVHLMELISYTEPLPPTFVAGNGGTKLNAPFSDYSAAPVPYPGMVPLVYQQAATFGFMMVERDAAGWTMTAYDQTGAVLIRCAVADRVATCTPLAP